VIHIILQVARGLVRPAVTAAFSGAFIAAVFLGLIPAEALTAATMLTLGWWFKERSDRQRTPTES
jgi:hypothetical protein